MKKLLAAVLALAMALALCTTAWADVTLTGEGTEANPYTVGTEDELKEAVEQGGYIKLTADVETTRVTYVQGKKAWPIIVKKNVTVILDGHKLSSTDGGSIFQVICGATLTIDGTVTGSTVYGRLNAGIAQDDLSKVGVTEENASINGTLVLNGGTYSCCNEQTVLHVNGGCDDSDVTIKGATITSPDDNGIQLNGKGTYLIENSTITGATAVYIKSGTLTVKNNSTLTGNMNPADYSYYGNGANPTGDAVVVDSCDYPNGAPTVTIENSTVIGTNAAVGIYEYLTKTERDVAAVTLSSGVYTGGTEHGAVYTKVTAKEGTDISTEDVKSAVTVTGGTYNTNVSGFAGDTRVILLNNNYYVGGAADTAISGMSSGDTLTVMNGTVTINGTTYDAEKNTTYAKPYTYYNGTPTTTETTDTSKSSPKTFDAGIAMYGVMAVMSVTGMAYVGKKKF